MAPGTPPPVSLGWTVSNGHTRADGFRKDFFAPRQLFDVVQIFGYDSSKFCGAFLVVARVSNNGTVCFQCFPVLSCA